MSKKLLLPLILLYAGSSFSQVLYSERFNGLSMNTGTYTSGGSPQTFLYQNVPSGMTMINNGSLSADTLWGNYPFRQAGQRYKAWMSYKHPSAADTFAVSTSWLNPQGTADAWLVTPLIANISANSVLTWEAMAPDISNADGYEVLVSTSGNAIPSTADFPAGNRIFFTAAEAGSWSPHGISLAAYAGQSIRLAFHNNSANKYQLWLDDIVVRDVASSYDLEAVSNNTYKYTTVNTNHAISASFRNQGATAISSMVLNYQVGNGAVISETQNFVTPLNYLESASYTFSLLYSSPTPGYYPLKVWVSAINGQADQVHSNDTVYGGITLSSSVPLKKVLVEEFTSATCAVCPDGYTRLSTIVSTHSNVIAASIHSSDNVTNATGTSLTGSLAGEGSSAMIDRSYYPGAGKIASARSQWETYVDQRQAMVVPVEVGISGVSYNQATREITADVSASFTGDVKGDYRINLYVKENNVYGPIMDISDNGWNQYSGLYNIQASPYYQVGYFLDASTYLLGPNQYSHQYVVTEFLDGAYGAAGVIPVNGSTAGQSYTKSYTYTLPSASAGEYRFNPDNIYLIGLVSEYGSAAVLNAFEVKLTSNPELPVGIQQLSRAGQELGIYPNPASGLCRLRYSSTQAQQVSTEIYNTLGELVMSGTEAVAQGEVIQQLDCSGLAEGSYQVVLKFADHTLSKKLIVIK